jgi:orotate phosphoribosyltransferase
MSSQTNIAEILLDIKAVHLSPKEPFTWVSGIKSPIYCDNRQIISYPEHRNLVAKEFAKLIKENFPKTQVIAGTATAGIPHAAWVASELNLPMVYVRSSSKAHGMQNLIEGNLPQGRNVILIEDLVSTGKSSTAAVKALEEAGAKVLNTYAIFSYDLKKSANLFKEINHSYTSLCRVDTLLQVAQYKNIINGEELLEIQEFFKTLE